MHIFVSLTTRRRPEGAGASKARGGGGPEGARNAAQPRQTHRAAQVRAALRRFRRSQRSSSNLTASRSEEEVVAHAFSLLLLSLSSFAHVSPGSITENKTLACINSFSSLALALGFVLSRKTEKSLFLARAYAYASRVESRSLFASAGAIASFRARALSPRMRGGSGTGRAAVAADSSSTGARVVVRVRPMSPPTSNERERCASLVGV